MTAWFQPDDEVPPESRLVDPEAYDASEQQFAASLDASSPRFRVEADAGEGSKTLTAGRESVLTSSQSEPDPGLTQNETSASAAPAGASAATSPDADAWRQEVAARLSRYRARRRPREPRYPSLRLKFENPEPLQNLSEGAAAISPATEAKIPPAPRVEVEKEPAFTPLVDVEATARVIPFPRSSAIAPQPLEELAEPVVSRPRILEAPEAPPPTPALGGILIQPETEPVVERRPGFEVPVQSAPFRARVLAAVADGLLVLAAAAAFGWIFLKLAGTVPPLRQSVVLASVAAGLCWAGYQYLLLVYAATTPGLKLARLRLANFDGNAAPRRIRSWRVLASILSAISLGLGYAWCLLDEDQLCWHDRITHTYLAPGTRARKPSDS